MKTHYSNYPAIFSITLIMIFFISCNYNKKPVNEETKPIDVEYSGIDHLRMFFETLHPNDQRKVFNALPYQWKYALFNNHLNHQLSMVTSEDQKNYIQDLINHLNPIYYSDTAIYQRDGAEYFNNQLDPGLLAFQNDTARVASILYEIGGDTQAEIMMAVAGQPDCECNIKKGYCTFFGNCGAFDCTKSIAGCGPAFLERCDGMCLMFSAETAKQK